MSSIALMNVSYWLPRLPQLLLPPDGARYVEHRADQRAATSGRVAQHVRSIEDSRVRCRQTLRNRYSSVQFIAAGSPRRRSVALVDACGVIRMEPLRPPLSETGPSMTSIQPKTVSPVAIQRCES